MPCSSLFTSLPCFRSAVRALMFLQSRLGIEVYATALPHYRALLPMILHLMLNASESGIPASASAGRLPDPTIPTVVAAATRSVKSSPLLLLQKAQPA